MRDANAEVGARVLELAGREYVLRGRGYVKDLAERSVVAVGPGGTPVRLSDIATVRFGPDIRRGAADFNGRGEAVGGIVVMRIGSNALQVIDAVKQQIATLQLPSGVELVHAVFFSVEWPQARRRRRTLCGHGARVTENALWKSIEFRIRSVPDTAARRALPCSKHEPSEPSKCLEFNVRIWRTGTPSGGRSTQIAPCQNDHHSPFDGRSGQWRTGPHLQP